MQKYRLMAMDKNATDGKPPKDVRICQFCPSQTERKMPSNVWGSPWSANCSPRVRKLGFTLGIQILKRDWFLNIQNQTLADAIISYRSWQFHVFFMRKVFSQLTNRIGILLITIFLFIKQLHLITNLFRLSLFIS